MKWPSRLTAKWVADCDEDGQSLVEYALILTLVGIGAITLLSYLGSIAYVDLLGKVVTTMETALGH